MHLLLLFLATFAFAGSHDAGNVGPKNSQGASEEYAPVFEPSSSYLKLECFRPDGARARGPYFQPNEPSTRNSIDLLKASPNGGIYVTVGGDRAFNGVALSNSSHLLILDYNRDIIEFAAINSALLKIARDRNDYLQLRLKADANEWAARAKASGLGDGLSAVDSAGKKKTVPWSEAWAWWSANVSHPAGPLTNPYHIDPKGDPVKDRDFRNANYLYDGALFKKVSDLAKANRIEFHLQDLSKPRGLNECSGMDGVLAGIKESKLKVSVLDLSNAWQRTYLFPHATQDLVKRFAGVANPQAILLVTGVGRNGLSNYAAAPLNELSKIDDADKLISKIESLR